MSQIKKQTQITFYFQPNSSQRSSQLHSFLPHQQEQETRIRTRREIQPTLHDIIHRMTQNPRNVYEIWTKIQSETRMINSKSCR